MTAHFYQMLPLFSNSVELSAGSQDSPACSSDEYEAFLNNTDKERPQYWERDVPHCHFFHCKSDRDCPGIEPDP